MKKIKFSTRTRDGVIIIPKKYKDKINNPVEVTLQYREDVLVKKSTIKKNDEIDQFFNNFRIDLTGFTFNRDEANKR